MQEFDETKAKKQIIEFISRHAPKNGVVIGLSGGIDSALVLALCVEALGKGRVRGIFMPESESDIGESIKQYVKSLGIQYEIVPIRPIFDAYASHGSLHGDKMVAGNLKARIRKNLLYSRSNADGLVVMGTGNRTELLIGYFTKYGDGGVDFLPIGDLYKAQVRQLAKYMGVPEPVITQPPSAGLWEGQTDEDELGITYEKLDRILQEHFDKDVPFEQINLPGINKEDIQKVVRRVEAAAPKLTMPPICQLKK